MKIDEIYEECYRIRTFEKKVEQEFEKGKMRGTTHGCIGQEIIPVLVMQNIDRNVDYITGTHRCHGQVLAYTKDTYRLACEMMGKADGFNHGMGGSQHIKTGHYITNGITGGMAAIGAGMAFSLKKRASKGIVISFLGDGGFQEGYVQETLNLAKTYEAPILYVMENNRYAMSTRTADYTAGSMKQKIEAFDMAYASADAGDIDALETAVKDAYRYVKEERKPLFLEIFTFRLCGHSKSDAREYMSEEEKQQDIKKDPLKRLRERLEETAAWELEQKVLRELEEVFERAAKAEEMDFVQYQEEKEHGSIFA